MIDSIIRMPTIFLTSGKWSGLGPRAKRINKTKRGKGSNIINNEEIFDIQGQRSEVDWGDTESLGKA